MNRIVKIGLVVIGVIIVALIVLALMLPRLEAVQKLNSTIATQLTERLGVDVSLGGDIEIAVFPRISASVSDVRVANPAPFQGDLARVGRLKANLQILPLFRKEIRTGAITIDQPYFDYIVGEDGATNLDPILARLSSDDGTTDPAQPGTDPFAVAINGINITNGAVRYQSLASDQLIEVSALNIDIGSFGFDSEAPIRWDFTAKTNQFERSAKIDGSASVKFNPSESRLFVTDLVTNLDDTRTSVNVEGEVIALDLDSKQLAANSIALVAQRGDFIANMSVARAESLDGYKTFSIANVIATSEHERGIGEIRLDSGHFSVESGALHASNASLNAKSGDITADLALKSVSGSVGEVSIINADDLSGEFKIRKLPYAVAVPNINIDLNAGRAAVKEYVISNNASSLAGGAVVNFGSDTLQASGGVSAKAHEIANLVGAALGEPVAALEALRSAEVNGSWKIEGDNIAVRVNEGALNDTALAADIKANLSAQTGDVTLDLGRIVVDEYLSESSGTSDSAQAVKEPMVIPPIPTGYSLNIRADEVLYQAQDLRVEDLAITAKPRDAKSVKFNLGGRVEMAGQPELIVASADAVVVQDQGIISVQDIAIAGNNSSINAQLTGNRFDIEMDSGNMRLKMPSLKLDAPFATANLAAPNFVYEMKSGSLLLNNINGSVAKDALSANIDISDLVGNLQAMRFESQDASIKLNGTPSGDVLLQGVLVDMSKGSAKIDRGVMRTDGGSLELQGNISDFTDLTRLSADVVAKGNALNIPLLARQFGVEFEPADANALSNAALDLDVSASLANLNIRKANFTADGGEIDLTTLTESGARIIDMRVANIDFSKWLPKSQNGSGTASQSDEAKAAFSPMAFLLTDNSRGTIDVDNVRIAGAKIDAIDAKLNVQNSLIELKPVDIAMYGGTSTNTIQYDYDSGALSFSDSLTSLSLGQLLADLDITKMFEGVGSASFNGSAVPGSTDLAQRLSGQGEVNVNDGALLGLNLKKVLVEAYSFYNKQKGREYSYEGDVEDSTKFSSFSAKIAVDDGVAQTSDIVLLAPSLRVSGQGALSLIDQSIDYRLNVFVDKDFDGQGAQVDFASLKEGVPIRIQGSATKPSVRVDLSSIISAKFKEEKDKALNKAVEKASEKYGGEVGEVLRNVIGLENPAEESAPEMDSAPEASSDDPSDTASTGEQEAAVEEAPAPKSTEDKVGDVLTAEDPAQAAKDALKKEAEELLKEKLLDLF